MRESLLSHPSSAKNRTQLPFVITEATLNRLTQESQRVSMDPGCDECGRRFKRSQPRDMMIFLHALRYSGEDWSFETPLPFWAHDDYDLL